MAGASFLIATLATVVIVAILATWSWQALDTGEVPSARAAVDLTYQCSMHPQVIADGPGQCPICGMNLSSVEPETTSAPGGSDHSSVHAPIVLSATREQLIGVKTSTIGYRELSRRVRTAGTVAYDPELYGLLSEYRALLRVAEGPGGQTSEERRVAADGRSRSLALNLRQLGISRAQLDALFRAGNDPVTLLLPGQSAWVYSRVYAQEIDHPRVEYAVTVTSPASPGRSFRGRVVTVDATSDPVARGVDVRVLVATPGGGLRPGMRVHVEIEVPLGRHLALPVEALLDTGTRQIVFVRDDGGHFEPRAVVAGIEADDYYQILTGLAAGEQIVTSANFLIDSESRFRAALAAFAAPRPERAPEPADTSPSTPR